VKLLTLYVSVQFIFAQQHQRHQQQQPRPALDVVNPIIRGAKPSCRLVTRVELSAGQSCVELRSFLCRWSVFMDEDQRLVAGHKSTPNTT